MSFVRDRLRYVCLLAAYLAIAGCGGGASGGAAASSSSSSSSSSAAATATISGIAFGSNAFNSGTLSAYAYVNGSKGTLLATGGLSGLGRYTLTINTGPAVLLELTGGCYTEYASLKSSRLPQTAGVCMNSSETLRAVFVPVVGGNVVNITPYTEAATGLASYLAAHGQTDTAAISTANQRFTSLVGINIQNTDPAIIDSGAVLDDSHKYGGLLGGMSTWVDSLTDTQAGQAFGTVPFTTTHLANLMSNDLNNDGLLDGIGTDSDGSQSQLTVGNTAMSATVYRHRIAAAAAMHIRYWAPFSLVPSFLPALVSYNNSKEAVFGTIAVVPLDESGASITNNTLLNFPIGSGDYSISLYIDDVVGLPEFGFEVLVDDGHYGYFGLDGIYLGHATAFVNTTIFPNGNHKVTVRVTNFLGSVTEQTAIINFQN